MRERRDRLCFTIHYPRRRGGVSRLNNSHFRSIAHVPKNQPQGPKGKEPELYNIGGKDTWINVLQLIVSLLCFFCSVCLECNMLYAHINLAICLEIKEKITLPLSEAKNRKTT